MDFDDRETVVKNDEDFYCEICDKGFRSEN